EESVSDEPSMLMEGPIPSDVIEERRVTFLPQFLGAFPRALPPLGALAYLGVRATSGGLVHEHQPRGVHVS
ncbi:hypothetical protein ACQ7B2_29920, partial [Escherichia coli]